MATKNVRVAINGFGRIGRLFFRQFFGTSGFEIVAINDLGDVQNLAYLLKYDSVYRAYEKVVVVRESTLEVDGKTIQMLQEKDPTKLPWKDLNIDIVIEATGAFESFEKASVHLRSGAKRVVISAPAKDDEGVAGGKTILLGINNDQFSTCAISSNGSCTTNAVAPIAAIMHEAFGVLKACMSTTHAYTTTQNLVDGPTKGKDFRRGRAAAMNIVPSSTGAAIAVTRGIPDLAGKFDGIALRVPTITGSLADCTFVTKRATNVAEVNAVFRDAAASDQWRGVVEASDEQLVSSDIVGSAMAAIVDLQYTKVIDGDLVKVLAWYDNEWGYVTTLVRHVKEAARYL